MENLDRKLVVTQQVVLWNDLSLEKKLQKTVHDLGFVFPSTKQFYPSVFERNGISTIEELIQHGPEQIRTYIPHVGKSSIDSMRSFLEQVGLGLCMKVVDGKVFKYIDWLLSSPFDESKLDITIKELYNQCVISEAAYESLNYEKILTLGEILAYDWQADPYLRPMQSIKKLLAHAKKMNT